ncbi:YihY/virulence factor BrkB family protein [bacterium]|nr:YihY/virulence factor BrkB family protein [bacterium]
MFKSAGDIFKIFWKEVDFNEVFDGAASLSYYFIFSIFPILLIFISLISYLPSEISDSNYTQIILSSFPESFSKLLTNIINNVNGRGSLNILSIGFLIAFWSGSSGFAAIIRQLNKSYEVEETRGFFKFRLRCLFLLLFQILIFLLPVIVYVLAKSFFEFLPRDIASVFIIFFKWPFLKFFILELIFLLVFASIYYFGPDVKQKFKFITPGSMFGSLLLIIVALLFEIYIKNYNSYDKSYGALGTGIILLLWLYLMGLFLILGASINQAIRKVSESSLVED